MSPGLEGTGRVADDVWLLAHHEVSGKPQLQPRALGLGVAGGLVAELVLSGTLSIEPGGVVVAGPVPPLDGLARWVAGQVASEPSGHPVPVWLVFLARTAPREVAGRLEAAGYLTHVPARPWRAERWVPADPDSAFAPVIRIKSALNPAQPPAAYGAALAGVAVACGLGARLALYLPPEALGHHLDDVVGQLGPGLHEVITQTQAAVDSAVLAHRA
jgi:Golgi phosphoprotein 3 (GPP34)